MKTKSLRQNNEVIATVNESKDGAIRTAQYGGRLNLKSKLSQFAATAALMWCANRADEYKIVGFLY